MPVNEAAKLPGVGRPALSNLLNGNAALSPQMAARLKKAFGADQQKLLKLRGDFNQHQQHAMTQKLVVGAPDKVGVPCEGVYSLDERWRALASVTDPELCKELFAPSVEHFKKTVRDWIRELSTRAEIHPFARKAVDLALAWPAHDENTLGDLVGNLHGLAPEDEETFWNLVEKWAANATDENRKATLRERIRRFAFVRRSAKHGLKAETRDRARKGYDLLIPHDPVTRNQWMNWKSPSST
jgi:hypothetical protein